MSSLRESPFLDESREVTCVGGRGGGGGDGKGDAIVRVGERKGELFFFVRSPRTVLRLTFFVSFISDEPDYNQPGSISPQKTTPGGQSHYSGRVVSVKQSAG